MFRAGVLTRRRCGNFVYYGVGDDTLAEICRTVCVHIAARGDGAHIGIEADPALNTDAARARLMAIAEDLDPALRRAQPGEKAGSASALGSTH